MFHPRFILCERKTKVTKAATSLGLLCDEIDILGADHGNVLFANYGVYKKLASSGVLSTGNQRSKSGLRL